MIWGVTCYRGRGIPPGGGASTFDFGFLTVSSTERIKQQASEAAVIALTFTTAGSQTNASKLSEISSLFTSTPNQSPPKNECEVAFRDRIDTVYGQRTGIKRMRSCK